MRNPSRVSPRGAEVFAITANGQRVRFDRLDPAPFAIDIGTSEKHLRAARIVAKCPKQCLAKALGGIGLGHNVRPHAA